MGCIGDNYYASFVQRNQLTYIKSGKLVKISTLTKIIEENSKLHHNLSAILKGTSTHTHTHTHPRKPFYLFSLRKSLSVNDLISNLNRLDVDCFPYHEEVFSFLFFGLLLSPCLFTSRLLKEVNRFIICLQK